MDYKLIYNGVEMPNVVSARITRQLNADASTMEVLIYNHAYGAVFGGVPIYERGGTIKAYASSESVDLDTSDELIGTYTIVDYEMSPDARTITLTCTDKTYQMLSRIFVGDETLPTNELVEKVVARINQDGYTQTPIVTNVATTKSNGEPFPTQSLVSATRTAYDILLELSGTSYTEDKLPYIFWFDENNVFHWVYPANVTVGTLSYGNQNIYEMKFQKSDSQIVNMVIYDAGLDKNDNSILGFALKEDAGSIEGKMIYQPMTKIAERFKALFQANGSYDSMTNDEFVSICEYVAKSRAETIIYNWAKGLWEATLQVKGAKYAIGSLYTIEATLHGLPATPMRMQTITHTLDKGGWNTTLKLQQDPEVKE